MTGLKAPPPATHPYGNAPFSNYNAHAFQNIGAPPAPPQFAYASAFPAGGHAMPASWAHPEIPHYSVQAPANPSFKDAYAALNQTRADIKARRGWHGSNLAVGVSIIGGLVLAGGVAVATVMTGGAALAGVAVAVGAASLILGGSLGGLLKTQLGKMKCRKDPELEKKIQVLRDIRKELAPRVADKKTANPAELRLYRDLTNTINKVDRGILKEAGRMGARTLAGTAVSVVVAAIFIAIVVATGGEGGGGGCSDIFIFGRPLSLPVPSGSFSNSGDPLYAPYGIDSSPLFSHERMAALKAKITPRT